MMSPGSSVMPDEISRDQEWNIEDHVLGVGIRLLAAILVQSTAQI